MAIDLSKLKVGVLYGGISGEREVSLVSGRMAHEALLRCGIDARLLDIRSSAAALVREQIVSLGINAAFIALHGEFGEDGCIQRILEAIGLPYTGSGPGPSFLAMDKIESKKIFAAKGVPTPDYFICEDGAAVPSGIKYPAVVKPYYSGSSLGVSIVDSVAGLPAALKLAFGVQDKALIEDYIEGRELTVGIFDTRPLAVVEIKPKDGYYDFTHKYCDGMVEFVAPARIPAKIYKKVQDVAWDAHNALGCRHFSRVDVRLGLDERPFVLEVNSIPGLTSHSLLPLSAKACGIGYDALIKGMLELAIKEGYGKKEIQRNRMAA